MVPVPAAFRPRVYGKARWLGWLREHGGWVVDASAALAPDRGVALAAVPRPDGGGRPDRPLVAAQRQAGAVRARAGDLLVRQPVPDRGGGAVARAPHRGAAGGAATVVHLPARE